MRCSEKATLLVASKCSVLFCFVLFFFFLRQKEMQCLELYPIVHVSPYPMKVSFYPYPGVCTDSRNTLTSQPNFLASTGLKKKLTANTAGDDPVCCRFAGEGRYVQPKYSNENAI